MKDASDGPQPGIAAQLRHRRGARGRSARQVDERSGPGARRLIGLLHLHQAELLGDALELAALADGGRPSGDLRQIAQMGETAWMQGDIARAVSHVLAVRERADPDGEAPSTKVQQQALITFATYARNLGKFRLARHVLDDLLRQRLDRDLLVDVLVLAASVWRGLGSLEGAQALIDRAVKRADAGDAARLARVEHQRAKLVLQSGKPRQAFRHLDRALALYHRAGDGYNGLRACLLRTEILEALGRREAALVSAREVLESAGQRRFARIEAFAHLEVGRLLMARGEADLALVALRRGLGSAVMLGDRNAELLAHARLSAVYAAMGEGRAAGIEHERAATLVARVDEVSPELERVRRGQGKSQTAT